MSDAQEPKCIMCDNPANLECKVGSCEPSTWWCSYHYMKKHHPEEGDEIEDAPRD